MAKFTDFKKYFIAYLKKELKSNLYYHGIHHTLEVYNNVVEIATAEKVKRNELTLLKTAALLHDCGFVKGYANHEEVGCELAKELLPKYEYTQDEIKLICGMIMATKIPQTTHNLLEEIIADADLLYLGTENYDAISDTLYEELKVYTNLQNEKDWVNLQITFLERHHYRTNYCIAQYSKPKNKNLEKIKKIQF